MATTIEIETLTRVYRMMIGVDLARKDKRIIDHEKEMIKNVVKFLAAEGEDKANQEAQAAKPLKSSIKKSGTTRRGASDKEQADHKSKRKVKVQEPDVSSKKKKSTRSK